MIGIACLAAIEYGETQVPSATEMLSCGEAFS
jgi:hypothetical protein